MSQGEFNFGQDPRDEGIKRVDDDTPADWKAEFHEAISHLASTRENFTAEDVREIVGDPPNHPNAFSAQFMAAVKSGRIVWTGQTVECTRRSSHMRGSGLKVYRDGWSQ